MRYAILGLIIACLVSANAASVPKNRNHSIVVTVVDPSNKEVLWVRESCQLIHATLNQFLKKPADIQCRKQTDFSILDPVVRSWRRNFEYHITLSRDSAKTFTLSIQNGYPKDETDFSNLSYKLRDGEKTTWKEGLIRLLANFSLYVENQDAYRLALLVSGVKESDTIDFKTDTGKFIDKLTGLELTPEAAFAQFASESERKKNYLRAGVEIGAFLGGGLALYYKNLAYNKVDFDYGLTDGLRKKLITGEAILFDDNAKWANAGHALAGVLYYQLARSNGMDSLESFLVTVASSTMWEILEYHEVLSINDQIITPIGGYVIGEATHQIACALRQKRSDLFARGFAVALDPATAVNRLLDSKKGRAILDDCDRPRWSDINVYLGVEGDTQPFNGVEPAKLSFGFSGDVVTIPGYTDEGASSGIVMDTALSKFLLEGNIKDGRVDDFRLIAKVVSVAWNKKRMDKNAAGELEGYDFVFGLGHGVTWNDREDGMKDDYYGTINIAGPTAVVYARKGDLRIRAEFGIYADFVMVKSYALEKYAADHSTDGLERILDRQQAYWGFGHTVTTGIVMEHGRWEAGFNAQLSSARMIHERNRFKELATSVDPVSDSYNSRQVWVGFRINKSLKVRLSYEEIRRHGEVAGYTESTVEKIKKGYLVYEF